MNTPHPQPHFPIDRRAFLKSAAAAALAPAALPNRSVAAPSPNRPNVLFILADQWRHHAFAHAGDSNVRTPHFDTLADQSARWSRCYASNPVCTPNRSCIITGRLSHQHGMINNNFMLPPSEHCIAEVFTQAGYATHYVGKWHMDGADKPGFVPPGWRRRGYQSFEGFNRGHYYPTGSQYFTDSGDLLRPDAYEPTYQTDLAINFMKAQHAADRPFYCHLSWGPPHTPYRPPENFNLYDLEKDPYEMNNRADSRAHAALRDDLLKQLIQWGKDTADPYPGPSTSAKPFYSDDEAATARL